MIRLRLSVIALTLVAFASPAWAQPVLKNAQVTNATVAGTLEATVTSIVERSAAAAWIGWQVPSVPRQNGENWCWSEGEMVRSNRLEPSDTLFVFLRIEGKQIDRVRIFDQDCPIDAGSRPVTWLRDVRPADSITLLAALIERAPTGATKGEKRISKGALAALSQHAGSEAVQPLVRFARRSPDASIRGEALFWLAQRAGREAVGVITDAIENDPETQVKKRAVFALSQLPASEGVPKLIEVARHNANPVVRKQAIFWLGQSKDTRALDFFEELLK